MVIESLKLLLPEHLLNVHKQFTSPGFVTSDA